MPLIEDFVNREDYLTALWKIIRRETDVRLVLVGGSKGIGKTYLLKEIQAECAAAQPDPVACVQVDFAARPGQINHVYLDVVRSVFTQLGKEGIDRLAKILALTHEFLPTPPVAPPVAAREPVAVATGGNGGRSGGVDFGGPATIGGDVVGRDVIYQITQVIQPGIQRDDPWVQSLIQTKITDAWREHLIEITSARTIVFLFDSWQWAATDVGAWLGQHLLSWILDKTLPGAVGIVAGLERAHDQWPPPRFRPVALPPLPEEAVRIYWVEKRRLPPEDVENIIKYTGGHPQLLALLADRQAETKGLFV